MVEVFVVAFWVGLAFNAAPGAVFGESLRRGMRGGFRPAFAVQVGSLAGDAVWAVLGLTGVGALFTVPALRVPLTVGGCLLLCWLGVVGLRDAFSAPRGAAPGAGQVAAAETRPLVSAVAVGAGMSLGNPWNVVYWSGAAGAVGAVLGRHADVAGLATFFTGFMASSLVWCFVSAGFVALLRRAVPPPAVRVLEGVCGLALIALAVVLAARLVTGP
ncbi:LysE family transporter [Nonomuraea muscovyensis]